MIGITERGDASINLAWIDWVKKHKKPAILITKNPGQLRQYLSIKDNIIVHCTITGYGGTILEPNVPAPEASLQGYQKIIKLLGAERVVLRVDPIICTEKGVDVARKIIKEQQNTRVRISFLDLYPHVIQRFREAGIPIPCRTLHFPKILRQDAYNQLSKIVPLEVCGEPDFLCTGCISPADCKILGVEPTNKVGQQRKACSCLTLKKELLSNKSQCHHKCLYCYWK